MITPDPNTAPTEPTAPKENAAPRKKPDIIDSRHREALKVATDCHRQASNSGIASAVAERKWTPQKHAALGTSILKCERLIQRIQNAIPDKETMTEEEAAARTDLFAVLAPVQKAAKLVFTTRGEAQRKKFGIGIDINNQKTPDLINTLTAIYDLIKPGPSNSAPAQELDTLLPAEIEALHAAIEKYEDKDFAQQDAAALIVRLKEELDTEITTVLNKSRRDLQGRADLAFPHDRQPSPTEIRRAFHLPEDSQLIS
jgi:hypothetical protein